MTFIEEKNDLFNYEGEAWLAHCISADFGMGKGIVVKFNERYDLKNYMIKNHVRNNWSGRGYCIPVSEYKVFNLVTKDKYYKKPTYGTVKQALIDMRNYALAKDINKIAMPTIAAGLDFLTWSKVREIIQNVFNNTDIEIIVCRYKGEE